MNSTNQNILPGKWFILIVFLVLIAIAVFVRFYNLQGFGIIDNDTVHYSDLAKCWSDGVYLNPYAKIGYHLLGAIAIKILGYYDYALPYLSSFLDVFNVLFIFLICSRLGISPSLSLAASGIYACLPGIIEQSYIALPHIASSSFIMFSFLMLLKYIQTVDNKKAYIFLAISAMALIYAGTVHPSTFAFIPIFAMIIFLANIDNFGFVNNSFLIRINWRRLIWSLFFWGVSIFFVLLGFAILMNKELSCSFSALITTGQSLKAILIKWVGYHGVANISTLGLRMNNLFVYLFEMFKQMQEFIPALYLRIFFVLCLLFIIWGGYNIRKNLKTKEILKNIDFIDFFRFKSLFLPFFVSTVFILICFWEFKTFVVRVMVPLVPFLLIISAVIINLVFKKFSRTFDCFILAIGIIMISLYALFTVHQRVLVKSPDLFRQTGNVLMGKVNDSNNMLVAPYFTFRNVYEIAKYVPPKNVYYVKRKWQFSKELLAKYKIRYIVVTKTNWDKGIAENTTEPWNSTAGIKVDDEIITRTMGLLYSGIESISAKQIYKSNQLEVYEVPLELYPNDKITAGPDNDLPFYNIIKDVAAWRSVVAIRK